MAIHWRAAQARALLATPSTGQAAAALEVLLGIFPEWQPNVLIGDDPAELTRFVLDRLS